MPKKIADPDREFIPSDAFPGSIGFFVRAEVALTDGHIGYAWEPDGYEVVFTADPKALLKVQGKTIDIPGHAILNYSGAQGPWAPARIRVPEAKRSPEDLCSECRTPLDDGEGYDGLCGSCADKADAS